MDGRAIYTTRKIGEQFVLPAGASIKIIEVGRDKVRFKIAGADAFDAATGKLSLTSAGKVA